MTFDEQAATMKREDVAALLARYDDVTRQLAWLKQQLFGSKSERRFLEPDPRQLALGEWKLSDSETTETTVSEHQRRTRPARPEKD